jgi:pseudouridine-5'-phosphate glycosidase
LDADDSPSYGVVSVLSPTGPPVVDLPVVCCPDVAGALERGLPVVALESTILSHGLPRPMNLEVGRELEDLVRAGGAVPATVAVLDGVPYVGLEASQLERVTMDENLRKVGLRDLPMVLAAKASGGTTVSATAALASRAGVRVFATGGLGGVHRGWHESWDESADLLTLSLTRIAVVSSGVKSILDIGATLQRLETLNVGVVGYRTDTFPAFYLRSSGYRLDWRVDAPEEVAAIMSGQDRLGLPPGALLIANPLPAEAELQSELHDRVLTEALAAARRDRVSGQALTPFLLQFMLEGTGGASLDANLAAVRSNVRLATQIAVAFHVTPSEAP